VYRLMVPVISLDTTSNGRPVGLCPVSMNVTISGPLSGPMMSSSANDRLLT
jgi:hypothetical protein